jgi:hypothetical protein
LFVLAPIRGHAHALVHGVRPKTKNSKAATEIKFKEKEEVPMKSHRYRMLVVAAIALAAICASVVPAAAQNAFQGSFTLPTEVRWQGSTLPAGDYTFTMKTVDAPNLIILNGPNGSSFVSALVGDRDKISDGSVLIVEQRAGKSCVRELYMAQLGLRLRYAVPKAPKEAEIAQAPVTTERIFVAMK